MNPATIAALVIFSEALTVAVLAGLVVSAREMGRVEVLSPLFSESFSTRGEN